MSSSSDVRLRQRLWTGVINVPGKAGLAAWLCRYFYYLIYLVVPYAAPFAVALLIHPEWRAYFTIPEQRGHSDGECG